MNILKEIKWSLLPKHTYCRICKGATMKIGKEVRIHNCRIIVTPGSSLEIGDYASIENSDISVSSGQMKIGPYSIIGGKTERQLLNIEKGSIHIGHHTKICARRFWVRFGGAVRIGCYTNINSGSEIRCDESVTIGSYNQISYSVNIWDTNTHSILPKEERRRIAEQYYPYFGKELAAPLTSPVEIGDDCWLGQGVTVLKGSIVGDGVIVGVNSIIPGKTIPANSTVVTDISLKVIKK